MFLPAQLLGRPAHLFAGTRLGEEQGQGHLDLPPMLRQVSRVFLFIDETVTFQTEEERGLRGDMIVDETELSFQQSYH